MFMQEEVERGTALLDQRVPGWRERINLEKLDIGSPWQCVLGQLYGDFFRGLKELGIQAGSESDYGFVTTTFVTTTYFLDLPAANRMLTSTWKSHLLRLSTREGADLPVLV